MADTNKSGGMGKLLVAGGCGCLVILMLALVTIGGIFFFRAKKVVREEPRFEISIKRPDSIEAGGTFDLEIDLNYSSGSQALKSFEIDLPLSYLEGFEVVAVDPEPLKIIDNEPFEPTRSYRFERQVRPGEQFEAAFQLQALEPGSYSGELGVQLGDLRQMYSIKTGVTGAASPAEVFGTPPEPAQ